MYINFNDNVQIVGLPFAKRSYRTQVDILGFGGHIELGRVQPDVASYWREKNTETFGKHIFIDRLNVEQRLDGNPINPRRSRKKWGCICNIEHVCGVELEGRVEIRAFAENGNQLLDFVQQPDGSLWPIAVVDDRSFYDVDPRQQHVTGRTFDIVCSSFMVESDKPFNRDLMKLNVHRSPWGTVITSITYDGRMIDLCDQTNIPAAAPQVTVLRTEEKSA